MQSSLTPETDSQNNPQTNRRFGIGLLELLLLILTVVGGILAFKSQSLASQYRSRRLALEAEIGDLKIDDPSKYYVQLLKSDDPLELRWRIYMPKENDFCNYAIGRDPTGSSFRSGGRGSSEPGEAIYTIRLTPSPSNSTVAILSRMSIQRSSSTVSSNTQNAVIHSQLSNRDFSSWEIAGRDGVESFDANEFRWLLRVQTDFNAKTKRFDGKLSFGVGSSRKYLESQNEE